MDASLRAALTAAVEGDPGNAVLRVHVVEQLQTAGDLAAASDLVKAGLATAPADVGLLQSALHVATAAGRTDEAAGYQSLLTALGQAPPAAQPAPTAQQAPPPAPPWVGREALAPPEPAKAEPVETEQGTQRERAPLPAGDLVPDSVDDLLDLWNGTEPAEPPPIGELSRSTITLADVGGMYEVKQRINTSFLLPMRNLEMRQAFGKSMRGGLLLWGPPGCGKTFMARAIAGEMGASFYHVGLSDVLDMWIGSSERNITALFEIARQNSPCVLFLDEVDALGQKRSSSRGGGGAMRGVVNQLLQEMDGAGTDNEGVFVLAATNHPWDIDSALLRPGRLDRTLLVLPPDVGARETILDLHLRGRPIEGLDLAGIAKRTDGLTGADLALLCEQATEFAMLDSIESGQVRPITMTDLQRAAVEVRPSYGPWCDAAKNYALFNNDSGRYDELLTWLKKRRS